MSVLFFDEEEEEEEEDLSFNNFIFLLDFLSSAFSPSLFFSANRLISSSLSPSVSMPASSA
jgi:hypothetical protein